MPRVRPLAILLLAALSAAAPAQNDFIAPEPLRAADLMRFWQIALPLDPGQRVTDAYLVDDQIYACTQDGFAFAIHAPTGALRWMNEITRGGYRIRKPAHAGSAVIFAAGTQVLKFDRVTGDPLGVGTLKFAAGTGVASDGERYFLGGLNGRFYCYDALDMTETWKAGTNASITSTPAVYGEVLYVAGEDTGIYACTTKDKRLKWQSAATGSTTADVVAGSDGVFIASRDLALFLYDLEFGQIRWRARFSGPLYEPPVLAGDAAFQFCPDDGLVAVETDVLKEENRIRWRMPRGRALLTVDPKRAYALTQDETIVSAELKTGAVGATIPAPGFIIAIPSPTDGAVIVASPDGRVFCARAKDVPFVKRDELRKALQPSNGAAASQPTSQPAAKPAPTPSASESLRTTITGPATGGKSKVSREYGAGGTAPKSEKP